MIAKGAPAHEPRSGSRLRCSACPPSPCRPAEPAPSAITVFAAASLTEAFGEIGRTLERRHPGMTVQFNFAGSQQLALQMEQGAPADVFASADQRWMDYATDKGLIEGEAPVFARNRLVVIVPKTNPARIEGLPDLARRGPRSSWRGGRCPWASTAARRSQKLARRARAIRQGTTAECSPTWSRRRRT